MPIIKKSTKKYAKKTSVIKRIQKDVNKLQRENPPNFRFNQIMDDPLAVGLVNSSPQYALLNGFVPGTDELTRVGDIGHHISSDIAVKILSTSNLLVPTLVRIIVVREKTALGSLPSVSSMFNSSTPTVDLCYNNATREASRYIYYYDKVHAIYPPNTTNATGGVSGNMSGPSTKLIRISLKKTFKTDYSRNVAGTVSDIDDNTLTLLAFTDNAVASAISIYYSALVKYAF